MTVRRAGRMHRLVIGTKHAGKRVLALADDHHVTVADLYHRRSPLNPPDQTGQDLLAQPKPSAWTLARLLKLRPMTRLI
jgi:hypothetical protein